jgi:two-component system, cell cycle response regulator DivK
MIPPGTAPRGVMLDSGPSDREPGTRGRPSVPGDGTPPTSAPLVLVAEDHADSRNALRVLLEAVGYRVAEASNGAEALERARTERPDVVLLDLMMPVLDGLSAARGMRAIPELSRVPIVALTALDGARGDALAAGCDDLMAKPLDLRRLLERLPGWIGARPA